jgi:hypothetical protein
MSLAVNITEFFKSEKFCTNYVRNLPCYQAEFQVLFVLNPYLLLRMQVYL